jgi:Leucine-rich repeat (LRR) protein
MQNMPREPQQGIVEGTVSTTSPNQEADEDALPSSITARIPPQHYVLREERKQKKQMQQSQGSENETDDAESQQPGVKKDVTELVQVGAFPEASSVQVLSSNTEARTVSTTPDSTALLALNAHVVDEEESPLPVPIFEATNPTDTKHLKALLQSRKCRIILAVAIMFGVGLIVAVVLLTQNGSQIDKETASKLFLADLKPLLSNESLTALNNPDSPQSQSLQWLLEKSNFQAWPFHRQVQRFAMATIYYATGGPSWNNDAGGNTWLTNAFECEWFQGYKENFCNNNNALVSLSQPDKALQGTIPDEIGLLTSLTYIGLFVNYLSGTVPSQLGSLTALTSLGLYSNSFTGTVPSELGSLTALTRLWLWNNSFNGTVPSQLGSLTALTRLELSSNSFTGTVPSELGSLTALTYLDLSSNLFNGTVPSELGSLTALELLALHDNVGLNGTVPAMLCNLGQPVSIRVDCNPGPQCSCCICYQP